MTAACVRLLLVIALSIPPAGLLAAAPQSPSPESLQPAAPRVVQPPVPGDVERIRRALSQPAPIRLRDTRLRFSVDIVGKPRTFADYVRGFDLVHGKTKGGNPMTHGEFLNLVTPRNFQPRGGLKISW